MKADGMTRVRAIAMKLADVEEGTTFGYPAFKVRGKTFAWFPKKKEVEDGSLGVRMSILEREHWIKAEPAIRTLRTRGFVAKPVGLSCCSASPRRCSWLTAVGTIPRCR